MAWKFNNDHDDRGQVQALYAAYLARRAELDSTGRYPYNDLFVGHLGVEFASRKDEDRAIYLLQREHRLRDLEDQVREFCARGGVPVEPDRRYREVLNYGYYVGGTGIQRFRDLRIRATPGGSLCGLPKGARTKGHYLFGTTLGIPA